VVTLAAATAATAETPADEQVRLARQRQALVDDGRYDEAIPVSERLIAVDALVFGPDHRETLTVMRWLASLHQRTGDWAGAAQLYERVIATLERTRQTGYVDYGYALQGLAGVYREEGDHERAAPLFQKLLARAEETERPEGSRVAEALADLARLYRDSGDPARAEPLLVRALAIVEERREPATVAVEVTDLGGPREEVKDRTPAGVYRGQAALLTDLALLHEAMGEPGRAEPLLSRALALNEKAFGPEHPSVAVNLGNLALVQQALGDPARAEASFNRSIALREKLHGPNHPSVAVGLHGLARLCLERGEPGRAEALARRALAIVEKAHGPDHRRTADVLLDLSDALVAEGRVPEARPLAERAATIQDRDAAIVLAVGSESQKRAFVARQQKVTFALVSLHTLQAPADPAAARLALRTVLRRKGRVLDAMADGFAALRRRLDPAGQALLGRLSRVSARIAAERGDDERARTTLTTLEAERRQLEADIGQRSAAVRADQGLSTVDEIERALPADGALVEIARYRPFRATAAAADRWGMPRYAAYVVRPGHAVGYVDLGDAGRADAEADALRRALADPDLTRDPRGAARAAATHLFAPLASLLGDARQVLISPDGALALVPFGALVGEDGRYLAERLEISYLDSGRDLLRLAAPATPREGPLLVADPAFGPLPDAAERERRGAATASLSHVGFTLLPGSAREARAIAPSLPGARVLLGAGATEAALRAARGPSVLHVATHGFFLPGLPEAPPGPELDPSGAERAAALRRESPLLRSGIALAGANRGAGSGDDGILTALEASTLDLLGTRLVVLSACETGLGEASAGEGVSGMRRALAMAGAETTVMSLWPVDTGATRDLMIRYHQRLAAGAGRSAGLREAQLAMLADPRSAHPNLWAAFIVSGSTRALDGRSAGVAPARLGPGARGCGCGQAGGAPGEGWSLATALALALAILARAFAGLRVTSSAQDAQRRRRAAGATRRSPCADS
jgi:CHAT domain-containing protein/tetratricopeptide (TPR) repeat protein